MAAPSGIAAGEPGFAASLGERPDAQDVGGALGHADGAARVEQVEQMARLQALVIGWQAPARVRARRRHSRSASAKCRTSSAVSAISKL